MKKWSFKTGDLLKEIQFIDRCNRSMLALTNSRVHIPGNGICVDNKNPHSPACNVSVLAADDIVT
jgi:hypothetical protein